MAVCTGPSCAGELMVPSARVVGSMSARCCSRVLSLWRRGQRPRCSSRLAARACHLLACITLAPVRWETTRAAAARWLSHGIRGGWHLSGIVCP
eukprot:871877-Pyramimonas_sp.AAC.1